MLKRVPFVVWLDSNLKMGFIKKHEEVILGKDPALVDMCVFFCLGTLFGILKEEPESLTKEKEVWVHSEMEGWIILIRKDYCGKQEHKN